MHISAEQAPLDPGSVDVIVSEWMGYFLIFERMLPSVVAVRNRCLLPEGIMIPRRSKVFLAAFTRIDSPEAQQMLFEDNRQSEEALITLISAKQIISSSSEILDIDLMTVDIGFDSFNSRFELLIA